MCSSYSHASQLSIAYLKTYNLKMLHALTPAPVGQSQHRASDSILENVKVRGLEIHPEVNETRNEHDEGVKDQLGKQRRFRRTLLQRIRQGCGNAVSSVVVA